MTLIEIMISFVVLTVGVFMLSSTITASIAHTDNKRERALAMEGAMNYLETMRAQPFRKLFALYNQSGDDDPAGVGTAPGHLFDVAGLEAWSATVNRADPLGEVIFPGPGPTLVETLDQAELGLPRDLNGDLQVNGEDVSDQYQILPAIIRITWSSSGGRRQLEIPTIFSAMEKAR